MSHHNVNCEQLNEHLIPYLKGDLTREQMARINAHLQTCDRCALRVHEARRLEAELYHTAVLPAKPLSEDASLRIQANVYRKMRRTIFLRRTGQLVQASSAIALFAFALVGTFALATYWLPFMSDNADPIVPASNYIIAEKGLAEDTAVTDSEIDTLINEQTIEQPLNYYRSAFTDSLVSATPGQTPEEIAAAILDSALSRDHEQLFALFAATSVMQEPNTRMWKIFANRCDATIGSSRDFDIIKAPLPFEHIASVRLYYNDRFSGEIKMRKFNGEWFTTFTQTPYLNQCIQDYFDQENDSDYK